MTYKWMFQSTLACLYMSTQVSVVMFLEQMISQCLWRASSWKNLAEDRSFEAEGLLMSQTHQAFRFIMIKSNRLIKFKIHKHLSEVLLQFYVLESLHLLKINERLHIDFFSSKCFPISTAWEISHTPSDRNSSIHHIQHHLKSLIIKSSLVCGCHGDEKRL